MQPGKDFDVKSEFGFQLALSSASAFQFWVYVSILVSTLKAL